MPDVTPTLRTRLEGVSRPLLVRLSSLPRQAVPLGMVALLAVAVLAPPPLAVPALVVVFVFLVWLTFLAWPAVGAGGKVMRLGMLGLVLVLGLTRL